MVQERENVVNRNFDNSSKKGSYLEIKGGKPLSGKVSIPGAKNAALPALVAACLSDEDVILHNVPLDLNDVKILIDLLRSVGANIRIDNSTVVCNGGNWRGGKLNAEKANKIRHSLLLLGATANWGAPLFLPVPGGCSIGERKYDLHVMAFEKMGFTIVEQEIGLDIRPTSINDESVVEFYYPTFGGTLNVLLASVRSKNNSTVILKNAARNPEILDVISLLRLMGANIKWLDYKTLKIIGVRKLTSTSHNIISDRIVAATIIAAVGITKGRAFIENASTRVLESEIGVWKESGLKIDQLDHGVAIEWERDLEAIDITTKPYPGFHTDIQPLHVALMTTARGVSEIKETILDGRFIFCKELIKMGANIEVIRGNFECANGAQGQVAKVTGQPELVGTNLDATDIRGGAAVAIAALGANGISRVHNLYQIQRGYNNFKDIFNSLGADIQEYR